MARERCAASRDASDTPPSLTAALEHPAHAVCTRGLLRRPNYQRGGEFCFSLRPRSASTVARSKLTLLPRDPSKEFDREATADYPRTTGLQGGEWPFTVTVTVPVDRTSDGAMPRRPYLICRPPPGLPPSERPGMSLFPSGQQHYSAIATLQARTKKRFISPPPD